MVRKLTQNYSNKLSCALPSGSTNDSTTRDLKGVHLYLLWHNLLCMNMKLFIDYD